MRRHFEVEAPGAAAERLLPRPAAERSRRRRYGEQVRESAVPLYYDDGTVIHACWSAIAETDVGSVQTRCDAHVPEHEAFTLQNVAIDVTCPRCRAVAI